MKGKYLIFVLFIFSASSCMRKMTEGPISDTEKTDVEIIQEASWATSEVSKGVTWKYFHFEDLFKSKQSVTLFDVDLNEDVEIDIPNVNSGFLKTSDASNDARALIGFNGGFFNTSTGGSTVFFKKEGKIIQNTRDEFTSYRESGAMVVDKNNGVTIVKKPVDGWENLNAYTALVSGPLLLYGGHVMSQEDKPFNSNRHPRTAVGITKNNSSTAWVKNHGVVNYPCDNKKFDHQGERGVATVIVVK